MRKFGLSFLLCFLITKGVFATATDNWVWTDHNESFSKPSIVSAVVDPTDSNKIYILTSSSGVYKSTDGGSNWSTINTGLPSTKTLSFPMSADNKALAIDPNNSSILYTQIAGRIYKTTDAGANWTISDSGISYSCGVYSTIGVIVDPTNSNHLLAGSVQSGCTGGLFESTDGGANWTITLGGAGNAGGIATNDAWPLAIDPADTTKKYVSTVHLENYYTNDGTNWSNFTFPSGFLNNGGTITTHATNHQVFIGTADGLATSTDFGATWQSVADLQGKIIGAMRFSPSDPTIAYVATTDGKIYKSTNSGVNWSLISTPGYNFSGITISQTDANTAYFISQNDGIYLTTNGGLTLTNKNTGLPIVGSLTKMAHHNGVFFASLWGNGCVRSTDNGYNWSRVLSSGYIHKIEGAPSNSNTIYAASLNPNIFYKSTDNGVAWESIYQPSSIDTAVHRFAVDPTDQNTIHAILYNKQYTKSTDGGQNWTVPQTLVFSSDLAVSDIKISPSNKDKIYVYTLGGFYYSNNGGSNWNTATGIVGYWVDDVTISPINNNLLYAGTRDGVLLFSNNAGASWSTTTLSTGLSTYMYPVADLSSENTVYVAMNVTSDRWRKSTDNGATWTSQITTGGPPSLLLQDPNDATRFFSGSLIFENYIPKFETSTFTSTPLDQSGRYCDGCPLNLTVTIKNTGPAPATNPTVTISYPNSGFIISNPITAISTIAGLGQSIATISATTTTSDSALSIGATIKSDEDVSGTVLTPVNISVYTATPTSSGGGSSSDPNCKSGWAYCIMAGPSLNGIDHYYFSSDGKAAILVNKNASKNDLALSLKQTPPFVPFPWMQRLNIASEIYDLKGFSAFNGYQILKLDNPATVLIKFDPKSKPAFINRLKFAFYDQTKKRWTTLTTKNIIDWPNHTIANTTKLLAPFVLVYNAP